MEELPADDDLVALACQSLPGLVVRASPPHDRHQRCPKSHQTACAALRAPTQTLPSLQGRPTFWPTAKSQPPTASLHFRPHGQDPRNQEAHQGGRQHPSHHQDDADDRHQQVRQGPARALATKPYTEGVFALVTELAATAGNIEHPSSTASAKADRQGTHAVITSDRGLCGPYNGSVLRTASATCARPRAKSGDIELVGKKGISFLRFNRIPVAKTLRAGRQAAYEAVEQIAETYMARFIAARSPRSAVVYMRYISAGRQVPEVVQLLPSSPRQEGAAAKGFTAQYEFSPEAGQLLDDLLPRR
jgi:hypothetical protein